MCYILLKFGMDVAGSDHMGIREAVTQLDQIFNLFAK